LGKLESRKKLIPDPDPGVKNAPELGSKSAKLVNFCWKKESESKVGIILAP
jgi:hypothetical protein